MRLPKDLLSGTYRKPNVYLCETDKTKICKLETTELKGSFKFNAYSELTFTVGRTYDDLITGEQKVNPYYDKIESLRLIFLEEFGEYFEIQETEIVSDGIKEVKNITAYSLEYSLSQKYLEDFYINTGESNSLEVVYAEDTNSDGIINFKDIAPIRFYDPRPDLDEYSKKHSLLHLILEKVYGWSIGVVDSTLASMTRSFEISRSSIYDFIMQDICEKFNCFVTFDTANNKINFYAESLVTKFYGDGKTTSFTLPQPYDSIYTVAIDSYKTTGYIYNSDTGVLTLDEAPANGSLIEVVDGAQQQWVTDVYVTFDNLAQEVNISYNADDIKTVLTVKGAEDLDIREVNFGLSYITDLSYYYTIDWMGQDLYDAYTVYLHKCTNDQGEYESNSQAMLELQDRITYEKTRLSLQYSIASNVTNETRGTYYVRGGDAPNYYYKEVSLPAEYSANIEHYYTLRGNDLNEEKFSNFYTALQTYYMSRTSKTTSEISALAEDFAFMETNTIASLVAALSAADTTEAKDNAVLAFLDELWNQLGLTPLDSLYYSKYEIIRITNEEAGWNDTSNENYWRYYPVTVVLLSLTNEKVERQETIDNYQKAYDQKQNDNNQIANNLLMSNNFTDEQLARLNPFLREDEYTDDNFIVTDSDSIESILKTKQELLECGRIELAKLCEPKLEFSMDMANIYALSEFEPIIHQFQLGNLINVVLRSDYVKRARLLEVDINFEDFSDFSCEFGELTNLKTPSSIHADLLSTALTAGKSVASNASYWNKGADLATSTDLKIQQGLLGAINGIYTSNQEITIDDSGIWLRKLNADGSFSPYQALLTSNNILLSTTGFASGTTPKMGLGEFTVDGSTFYGILAEAVLSGYIEGSTIVGGTIRIGERDDGTYNFEVSEDGTVMIRGGEGIAADITSLQSQIDGLQEGSMTAGPTPPENPTDGQIWIDTSSESQSVMKSWNEATQQWDIVNKDNTSTVFTKKPDTVLTSGLCYKENDLWIVGDDYQPEGYPVQTLLVCINSSSVYSDDDWVDSEIYNQRISNLENRTSIIEEHVEIADDGLYLKGLALDGTYPFYSRLSSTELSFCEQSPGQFRDADRDKVVWIGNNEMHAKETTIENFLKIEATSSDSLPCFQVGDFKFQIEENGSFSITK